MRNGSLFASFRIEAKKKYKRKSNTLDPSSEKINVSFTDIGPNFIKKLTRLKHVRKPEVNQTQNFLSFVGTDKQKLAKAGEKYGAKETGLHCDCKGTVSRDGFGF
jgi:hypothetical protein